MPIARLKGVFQCSSQDKVNLKHLLAENWSVMICNVFRVIAIPGKESSRWEEMACWKGWLRFGLCCASAREADKNHWHWYWQRTFRIHWGFSRSSWMPDWWFQGICTHIQYFLHVEQTICYLYCSIWFCLKPFQTILLNTSFMLLPENRKSENPCRVRCITKDGLMPDVVNEKWELVKITCTTFNKQEQFGISFITIHTSDTVAPLSPANVIQSPVTNSPKVKKSCDEELGLPKNSVFAKFRVRNDSSDSDKETSEASSLFSKWKEEKNSPKKESTTLTGIVYTNHSLQTIYNKIE